MQLPCQPLSGKPYAVDQSYDRKRLSEYFGQSGGSRTGEAGATAE